MSTATRSGTFFRLCPLISTTVASQLKGNRVFSLLLVAFDIVQTVEYHRYKLQVRNIRRPSSAFTEVVRDILSTQSAGPMGGAVLGDMQEGFRRLPPG